MHTHKDKHQREKFYSTRNNFLSILTLLFLQEKEIGITSFITQKGYDNASQDEKRSAHDNRRQLNDE
jgi:hypothetical protein